MISKPWRIVWFLFFAAGLNYADRTALSSVIPPLRAETGITDAQIGLAGTLFLWTYALVSPFAGNIADRFSRSKIITWSLVAWSLITVITGFAYDVTTLYVARIALGIAESFYLPAAGALIADHHGAETRGKATSYHMLGLNLGLVLGGSLAGRLAEDYGWHLGFWVLGGMGLVLAGLSSVCLSDAPTPGTMPGVAPKPKPDRSVVREAWGYCLRVPTFYCLLASAMAAGVASWIFLSWLPLFFTENYDMKLGAAGLAGVALYKAPVFIGIAIGGWTSDKVVQRNSRGRALIKGLSFIVSAPFLFFFMGAPTFTLIATMMILSSIIRAIGTPSEHPLICEVIPSRYRSTAIGIFNTCGSAAGGAGVLFAGVFKQDLGLNVIFGSSSFIYLFAGLLLLLAYWRFIGKDMARAEEQDRLHAAQTP
ncbi:MAG: MFS transporter [Verrucomicrobiota bacterium]